MKFILALLLAIFAVVFAENTATGLSVDVTEEDVKLTPASLAEFGPVPKCFDFSFRKCYYCKYACAFQFGFSAFSKERYDCLNSCSSQEYCKTYIKPEYKPEPVARFASAWRLVNVPAPLAVSLGLAKSFTIAPNQVVYKPVSSLVPFPWMCATPVEYVTPEYKPEPLKIACVTTPTYTIPTTPIRALRMYLTKKMMQRYNLIPYNGQVTIIGN